MKKWFICFLLLVVIIIGVYIWLGFEIKDGMKNKANGSNDYMIVLGAKVNSGGVPSLSLANRLDVAAQYLQQHPHVYVIVSGGQGADEDQTEASVMLKVLVKKGIERDRIILEENSTSTYENLLYSKELLPTGTTSITIVSNDFHLKRATLLAEKLGLTADTIAAPTPTVVELKSNIRERIALLKTYFVGQ